MNRIGVLKFRRIAGLAAMLGISGITGLIQAATTSDTNLSGRWTATIKKGDLAIPFRLDISVSGDQVTGKLYNGSEDFETTSSARLENGKIELNFEHYLTSIIANVKDGELDGRCW
jgi:hypothetical protein